MSLACKIGAKILKHRISHIVSDCAVDPVAAILAFARVGETGWRVPDCLCWILYVFASDNYFTSRTESNEFKVRTSW